MAIQENSKPDLESPLLPSSENGNIEHNEKQNNNKECPGSDVSGEITAELYKQVQLAGPLVVVSLLQYSLQIVSVMFIGHLDELSLSSASMASSFTSVTGFSFMLGMGSALETLCGQAYGAKQYYMLGIHMQRAMLVLLLMGIPISIIWVFTGSIFKLCGQDIEISTQAGIYACWLIPSIFPYGVLQCQLRFLQTQNSVKPLMIITCLTSIAHVVLCWALVFGFGFGSKGAALSIAISYWLNVVGVALYIKFSPTCQKTWIGFSKEGLKDPVGFLSLAVPSALMVCLEYWSYEFLVLMSGLLPNPKLETSMMSVSLSTSALIFRIPYGFGSAISTRVSNELGAGKPSAVRLAVQVVIFLAIAEGLLLSLILLAVRNIWGYMFTNEEEVVKYIAAIMPVLASSNFLDGIQGVLSGTVRGCGWQKVGAFVNLGAYYLVGLPCAIIFTFALHLGGKGLWIGIIGGSGLQGILLLVITLCTDWEYQAKKARDRVYAFSIPTDMVS
ncbi:Protein DETOXIFICATION 16 [Camellia lanceoleosa]|uniref:Protein DETOXIFICATION 16 n=1 Tax=Camellia lanceoleosa TaxID=1840588 RepID=A0ACC0HXX1_9ERIC|nr:Protein DETOXIFICATION 16 [Camellia lanceoleosa]